MLKVKALYLIHFILGKEMKSNTKILIYLIGLALLDMIIPIPFTTLLLIYVLLEKPLWLKKLVTEIYES